MDISQAIHLGSILSGIGLAIWFRPFSLIFFVPILLAFAALFHFLSGLGGWALVWAIVVDWLSLQIAHVLAALFIAKFFPELRGTKSATQSRHSRLNLL